MLRELTIRMKSLKSSIMIIPSIIISILKRGKKIEVLQSGTRNPLTEHSIDTLNRTMTSTTTAETDNEGTGNKKVDWDINYTILRY